MDATAESASTRYRAGWLARLIARRISARRLVHPVDDSLCTTATALMACVESSRRRASTPTGDAPWRQSPGMYSTFRPSLSAGWRHAYLVFSIASVMFVPLVLVLPWRRIAHGAPGLVRQHAASGAGPTVGQAVRDWPFWALTFSFAFTSVGIFAIVPQTMSYLLERGMEGGHAARALAVAGILTPLGMVGFSWLADRGGRRIAAVLAYA